MLVWYKRVGIDAARRRSRVGSILAEGVTSTVGLITSLRGNTDS